ncbi:hypothetical protein PFLG_03045 [Plasmodium falciparum RAJ116]|uniref:Uncharacterized protein n=1 Tax=Plasmodium falciparum RAJ116 TaxID=580058 RepID=A0A0L0D0D4_PLAFA|nr:hypothetical protein PFLG_03045 [Plasmodium falciparum RAJ116]
MIKRGLHTYVEDVYYKIIKISTKNMFGKIYKKVMKYYFIDYIQKVINTNNHSIQIKCNKRMDGNNNVSTYFGNEEKKKEFNITLRKDMLLYQMDHRKYFNYLNKCFQHAKDINLKNDVNIKNKNMNKKFNHSFSHQYNINQYEIFKKKKIQMKERERKNNFYKDKENNPFYISYMNYHLNLYNIFCKQLYNHFMNKIIFETKKEDMYLFSMDIIIFIGFDKLVLCNINENMKPEKDKRMKSVCDLYTLIKINIIDDFFLYHKYNKQEQHYSFINHLKSKIKKNKKKNITISVEPNIINLNVINTYEIYHTSFEICYDYKEIEEHDIYTYEKSHPNKNNAQLISSTFFFNNNHNTLLCDKKYYEEEKEERYSSDGKDNKIFIYFLQLNIQHFYVTVMRQNDLTKNKNKKKIKNDDNIIDDGDNDDNIYINTFKQNNYQHRINYMQAYYPKNNKLKYYFDLFLDSFNFFHNAFLIYVSSFIFSFLDIQIAIDLTHYILFYL